MTMASLGNGYETTKHGYSPSGCRSVRSMRPMRHSGGLFPPVEEVCQIRSQSLYVQDMMPWCHDAMMPGHHLHDGLGSSCRISSSSWHTVSWVCVQPKLEALRWHFLAPTLTVHNMPLVNLCENFPCWNTSEPLRPFEWTSPGFEYCETRGLPIWRCENAAVTVTVRSLSHGHGHGHRIF